jgi:uncharacterized spore protein YtfJ
MTTTTADGTARAAPAAADAGRADRLVERLAELVGAKAGVRTVFGEPIRQGDLTVVPVARVRWGFGGGGGRADDERTGGSGSGGGGGVFADPAGYLQISPGGATFQPIRQGYPSPAFILAAAVAVAITLRAVARLTRR